MGPIDLKYGLKIAEVSLSPTLPAGNGSLGFEPVTGGGKGVAHLISSFAVAPAFKLTAAVKTANFTPQALKENDVRCIQLLQHAYHKWTFAGMKDSDGTIDYEYNSGLCGPWLIDADTDKLNTRALDYPYSSLSPARKVGSTYILDFDDSPADNIALDMLNGDTKKWNYLWRFQSKMLLHAYVVFVHKSGEREPLAGCTWEFTRDLTVHWRDGKPQPQGRTIESTADSRYVSEPKVINAEVVFPSSDPLYRLMVTPAGRSVANIVDNAAIQALKTSPDVTYRESKNYPVPDLDPYFWM
jgi:hypothetical protein